MNEEIDEYEFYHQDFTTASEWEVFIARIEEILNEWRLAKSMLPKVPMKQTKKWVTKTEEIKFLGQKYTMSYHEQEPYETTDISKGSNNKSLMSELQNGLWDATTNFMDEDDGSPFPVSNWFGLKRYLVLCPSSPLLDGSLIKVMMSSVNIAFGNIDCGVPLFVKIREHWQHTYLGFYEDSAYRISFDTIHLKRISNHCSHLSGLVGLFKSKIASPVALDAVVVSTKFSYELKDLEAFAWKKSTQSNEFLSIDGFDVKKLIELPFGCEKSPVQSILLNAIWPKFRECTFVESSTFSDIDPLMAPIWTMTLKIRENISCQLSETIDKIMDLLDTDYLLMDTLGLSKSLGLVNPLHKITEAPITISKLVKAAIGQSRNTSEFKGPIADELLMPLLYYIFPDAVEGDTFNYSEKLEVELKQVLLYFPYYISFSCNCYLCYNLFAKYGQKFYHCTALH